MVDTSRTVEMGNLVCRFGPHVLLDYFDEIVYPSFADDSLIRRYGETSYFFEDVELLCLDQTPGQEVLGIAGRFIKDTMLTREQIYVAGEGLVQNHGSIQSSPSAIFLLILNSHRLVYLKETTDAPGKDTFRSTLLAFLRVKHAEFLKSKLNEIDELEIGRSKKTERKDELRAKHARPTLELIPLTTQSSIEEFIKQYELLSQIRITLSDRNDETDLDGFFAQVQSLKDEIGSTKTSVVHTAKKGLDKDEAIAQVTAATAQGNQSVILKGTDEGGDTLIGNNERFQLKTAIEDVSKSPDQAGEQLYEVFVDLVGQGLVTIDGIGKKARKVIASILERHFE